MPGHASWRTLLIAATLLSAGCEPNVSARAVWWDAAGEAGSQTIHVYDRGALHEFELIGDSIYAMRLDATGRGLLVRVDQQRAAWIDLADHRRLPFLTTRLNGDVKVAQDGSALLWIAFDETMTTRNLHVLPVAPGLPLERTKAEGVEPLVRPGNPGWVLTASDAPVALVAETDLTTLGLWRWPSDPTESLIVRALASDSRMGLPGGLQLPPQCSLAIECVRNVALDPTGELAVLPHPAGWQRFDVRAPDQDAPIEFPEALDELIANAGIGLIHVIDRDRSLWLSSGLLHWWNQRTGELRSLPVLGDGIYHVLPIERGHGVLFMSTEGPVLRADRDGLRPVSVVTTPCLPVGTPVVSPSGGWIAWACTDDVIVEFQPAQKAIVRVSALGLDRFSGVPMTPLAIDDDGHLLLTSEDNVSTDPLDGVVAQAIPHNLFVLSREGVLTRIDELEPSPAAVDVGDGFSGYIQASAI